MSANTATIRELRTDFRSVKRKLEAHGTLIITDRGEPAYLLSPVPQKPRKSSPATRLSGPTGQTPTQTILRGGGAAVLGGGTR